jgi:hypothetical protein
MELSRKLKLELLGIVIVLAMAAPMFVYAITSETKPTIENRTANTVGTSINARGFTTATFHVCCAPFNATVTFKGSVDGTNFYPLGCVPIDSQSALVATTTIPGIWRCNVVSLSAVRADVGNYVSGTLTVTVGLTAAGVS